MECFIAGLSRPDALLLQACNNRTEPQTTPDSACFFEHSLAFLLNIVMQHPHASARALLRRIVLVVHLFRASGVGVAASNVFEQHYTRTLAKTPDPSS